MKKILVSEISRTDLGLDDVISVYTFVISVEGQWITNTIQQIVPFNYIIVNFDDTGKDYAEFYHDTKGWSIVGIHDSEILNLAYNHLSMFNRYNEHAKVEDIVKFLIKIKNLNAFI